MIWPARSGISLPKSSVCPRLIKLAAIIAPAVLMPEGSLMLTDNLRLPAAILAAAIALRTGSVVATLLSGLGFIWLLGLL